MQFYILLNKRKTRIDSSNKEKNESEKNIFGTWYIIKNII